ncbi:unnamed protein product [Heligmosomoides polygyrus]|uniref:ER membrane protein complex subunit 10 n=1 Tax=Heligmosomoides polygyrus TaxID=6339 RepID=A0A183GQ93_HELPZ|nr:unnamed protein product [Heligmosomoides polygyrus]
MMHKCLLLQSNLFHYFWVSIDAERQLVQSFTVFPDVVAAGDKSVDPSFDCAQLPLVASVQPNAIVHVKSKGVLPTPDTQLFVQMMERERRARQHGAEADDRSFLGKYVEARRSALFSPHLASSCSGASAPQLAPRGSRQFNLFETRSEAQGSVRRGSGST